MRVAAVASRYGPRRPAPRGGVPRATRYGRTLGRLLQVPMTLGALRGGRRTTEERGRHAPSRLPHLPTGYLQRGGTRDDGPLPALRQSSRRRRAGERRRSPVGPLRAAKVGATLVSEPRLGRPPALGRRWPGRRGALMFDPLRLLASLFGRMLVSPFRRPSPGSQARDRAVVLPFPSARRPHPARSAQVEDCD